MDTIPDGHILNAHNLEWTGSWVDTISNGRDPEWTCLPNGHAPEWTPSRMDAIPNEHLHLFSYLSDL